eukprot:g4879.t1
MILLFNHHAHASLRGNVDVEGSKFSSFSELASTIFQSEQVSFFRNSIDNDYSVEDDLESNIENQIVIRSSDINALVEVEKRLKLNEEKEKAEEQKREMTKIINWQMGKAEEQKREIANIIEEEIALDQGLSTFEASQRPEKDREFHQSMNDFQSDDYPAISTSFDHIEK